MLVWSRAVGPEKPCQDEKDPFFWRLFPSLAVWLCIALSSSKASDGTWSGDASGAWSGTTNWSGGVVADGFAGSAYFSKINITADRTVHLDSARTLGNLTFGDTTTSSAASWILDNNGIASNVLTLGGGTPTITVNALGTGKTVSISAVLSGTAGMMKAGAGTLVLSGTNIFSGNTVVGSGSLTLGASEALQNSTLYYNSQGGTLSFGTLTSATFGGLSGVQNLTLLNASSAGVNLSVGNNGVNAIYTGLLIGTNSAAKLTKVGAGTLTLNPGVAATGTIANVRLTSGTLALTSGRLTVSTSSGAGTTNGFQVGASGSPAFVLDGGTLITSGNPCIGGDVVGGKGSFTLNSGTWSHTGGWASIGYGATGNGSAINLNGGLLSAPNIQISQNGSTTLNLNGGTLQVDTIFNTSAVASVLNFNGGVLKANSTQSNFISITGTLNVLTGGAVIDTNGKNVTVSKAIVSGTDNDGGLTKNGTGTLTLSSSNSYYGPTIVNAGTLAVGNAYALAGSTITSAIANPLTFNVTAATFGGLSGTWNQALTSGASPVALSVGANGQDSAFWGVLSGAGSLIKLGPGVQIFTGSNTYSGGTTLTAGDLLVANDSCLSGTASTLTFAGGLLGFTGTSVTNLNAHTVNWTSFDGGIDVANEAATFTIRQKISGSGTFTKAGPGMLLLTGTNACSGGTTFMGGELLVADDLSLGGAASTLTFAGGLLGYTGTSVTDLNAHTVNWTSFNGGIDVTDAAVTFTIGQNISGPGTIMKAGPGTLVLSGTNTQTGGISATGGSVILGNAAANSTVSGPVYLDNTRLVLSGSVTLSGPVSTGPLGAEINLPSSATLTLNVESPDGGGLLSLTGSGSVILGGTNICNQSIAFDGMTITITNPYALAGSLVTLAPPNRFILGANSITFGALAGTDNLALVSASSGVTLTVGGLGLSSTYSGIFSGPGSLTKTGTGVMTLTGSNSFTGGITLAGGELSVASQANLSGSTSALTFAGGQLQLTTSAITNLNSHSVNWASFNGGFDLAKNFTFTVSQVIGGTGAFIATGTNTATLALTASNSYQGGTTISGVKLQAASDSALGDVTAPVVLGGGGTLELQNPSAISRSILLAGTGTLQLDSGTSTLTGALAMQGTASSTLTKTGTGVLILPALSTTMTGITVNGGLMVITGGTTDTAGLAVGGTGTLDFTAGTLNSNESYPHVNGIMNVSGGTFNAGTAELLMGFNTSGAVLNLSGSGVVFANQIRMGNGSNISTLNLNGGTLQMTYINGTGDTFGFVNLNGTILKARSAQANFLNSESTYKVLAGGAIFDTAGYNITVQAPLLSGTTNDGGLTKTGGGTLTLTGTSTYTGPTLVSTDTLLVTGRLGNTAVTVSPGATLALAGTTAIGSSVTVASGAALVVTGTCAIGGSISIADGALLDLSAGRLSTGGLTLSGSSFLKLALGAAGDPVNSSIQVNGDLILDGSLIVYNRSGATPNQISTVIQYTGTLIDRGLVQDAALTQWNVTVDTSVPGSVKVTLTQKYPLVEFTSPNSTVSNSLQLDMTGKMHGFQSDALYYEVHTPDGQLWDFGSMAPAGDWIIHLRHLRSGTNTVRVSSLNLDGAVESDTRTVVLQLGANPAVRPRPWPAEVWWGGVATGQTPDYGYDQLVDPSKPWDFVKKYQDGIFLHGILPTASVLTQLAAAVVPTGGRFGREGGFYNSGPTYGTKDYTKVLTEMDQLASEGIYLSLTSQDFNPGIIDTPKAQIPVGWAGQFPTYTHQQLLDANMQEWTNFVQGIHAQWPGLKMGFTWSPVWFNWNGHPSLVVGSDSLAAGGAFNYDMQEFFNEASATAMAENGYFAFASDCPWSYILNWGNTAQKLDNQQKILGYEAWLRSQKYFHTRICNHDAVDATMQQNSYAVLTSQQAIGGRARTYLFESWYSGPVVWAPDADGSGNPTTAHAGTAMKAIKYLKGIKNLAGDLEGLTLSCVSSSNNYIQVKLHNDGDVECLPAIAGIESGGSATLRYYDAAYNEITTAVLSADGYVPFATLGTGQTLILYVQATGTTGQNRNVSLEAFWNPQDPTGIVRSRTSVTLFTGTAQSPYTDWLTSNNLDNTPGREAGFTDDPDADGISNGLEWIFSGNPLSKSIVVLPQVTANSGNLLFTFNRSVASKSTTTLTAEWGSNMVGWTPAAIGAASSGPDANGVTVTVTPNGVANDTVTVTVPRSRAVSGKLFVRLKATMP